MRIAYFCQYFPPEVSAPSARVSELARAWCQAGHDVTVVTGLPNHPTGVVADSYRKVIFRREQMGPIVVWRNWLYATPNQGLVRKTLSHLSFMISTLFQSVPRLHAADVLIVSSPSFFVAITVCVAHWLWRTPYIFEVRDLWPGVFVDLGVIKNRFVIRALEALEMFLYRRAALVVVVTDSFRDVLIRRGLSPAHVAVVTNGVDIQTFKPDASGAHETRAAFGLGSHFVVLYAGAHGISHGLSSILDVATRFRDDPDVCFVFVGDGAEKASLERLASARQLPNVRFFPSQPRDRMPACYGVADLALVPLRNLPAFETFIPSKMFEILACERPIVASVRGEARRILERSGGAVVVDPEDVDAIADAIRSLRASENARAQLGRAGGSFVRKEYDRQVLAHRYLHLIQAACQPA